MSVLTFNIGDYRAHRPVRAQDRGSALRERSDLVVLSSNSEPREYGFRSLEPRAAVLDIRSVGESHRSIPRRGKLLPFSNPAAHSLYMMPAQDDSPMSVDDDSGPWVA